MKRILLIDDEQQEFMLVNFLLKDIYKEKFSLNYAATITEAQDGLTSADTIPLLQQKAFNVPIIIISNDISGRHLRDRVRLGTNKVVDKFDLKKELANGLLE